MDRYCKRLIEVDLPIKRISAHARREKSIRHGHISTLHIWWARRPLAACRAVICASLWPDPASELCPDTFRKVVRKQMTKWAKNHLKLLSEESFSRFVDISKDERKLDDLVELRAALLDFIADFANWDNSTVPEYLETSRLLTQAAHEALGGKPGSLPLVVDPFAGGGAIPLESLRVGADAFASDLNPVAVLLNKVVLEYIPKYGQKLADEVRKWGEWIKEQAEKELAEFYPKDPDGATPIAYLWARTIQCEGPGCGIRIPLLNSLWLSKKKAIGLKLIIDKSLMVVESEIVSKVKPKDMSNGTIRRGNAVCPCCDFTTPRVNIEAQMKRGFSKPKMLAVVISRQAGGKSYRLPNEDDLRAVDKATMLLKSNKLADFIPNENLPYLRSIFNVYIYGIDKWEKLFDPRQKVAIATYIKIVQRLYRETSWADIELGKTICTCIGLAVDRLADFNSNIARWANHRETSAATFGRQALGMVWDYCETVPVSDSTGSFSGSIEWIIRVCDTLSSCRMRLGQVEQVSAAKHNLPDDICSLLFTDPPYYDAIPYANLSDFFYVWLKKSIGQIHPTLFEEKESPKNEEAVQLSERNPIYAYKTRERFESIMADSFTEGRRYTMPSGLGVIIFAHKTTSAWETLLSAVINSGWIVTGSWPLDTEMSSRLRANNSAVLASSVHLICRPRENPDGSLRTDDIGDWRDVLAELPKRIHEWMPRLAEEGVVGADAIFACLGPALEIYSRYSLVEKVSGERVSLSEYLEEVWAAISRKALSMIFETADASGFEEDARLTAMWLWTLRTADVDEGEKEQNGDEKIKSLHGYNLEYDAARKIAQGLGAHLENLSNLVEVKGDTATLLTVGARTSYLFGKDAAYVPKGRKKKLDKQMKLSFEEELKELEEEPGDWTIDLSGGAGSTVLDQLHQCMVLFGAGRGEALRRFLVDDAIGRNPLFWRLAQALSALYPTSTDEKRWVDGVLARKKGLGF
ncbi:MAG: DUF1156 domain-containing protein [Candidatus Aminicenantes bacterium]|nr:DUF1156 domain-containing protein [Candidatus Aminicenantes bacterium]